jgi:hypothetical protein
MSHSISRHSIFQYGTGMCMNTRMSMQETCFTQMCAHEAQYARRGAIASGPRALSPSLMYVQVLKYAGLLHVISWVLKGVLLRPLHAYQRGALHDECTDFCTSTPPHAPGRAYAQVASRSERALKCAQHANVHQTSAGGCAIKHACGF